MTRAVIYARVSTEMQKEDELPILGQVEECRKYAADKGWEVIEVFKDEGYSGGTEDRPAFQRMLEAARDKTKPFEFVITWRSNRLFRSVEQRLAYRKLFSRYKVGLVSLHEPSFEGATGRFIETVLAAADEMYQGQVSEDILRSMKQIARQGYSPGGRPPTGYCNKRISTGRVNANGEPIMRTTWVPDPILAPRLKQAFEMCARGASNSDIIDTTKLISSKNGLCTLLRNRGYVGERIYNTRRRLSLSEKKQEP